MALAQGTDILLLDEPTTYLDLAHSIEVLDLVDRMHEELGRTVVMVLHDLNLAIRYSDQLIVMRRARSSRPARRRTSSRRNCCSTCSVSRPPSSTTRCRIARWSCRSAPATCTARSAVPDPTVAPASRGVGAPIMVRTRR